MSANPESRRESRVPSARPSPGAPAYEDGERPNWFTAGRFRDWGTSTLLHAALLLVAGLWYFTPPSNPPRVLDTRLAGSENGVDEGVNLTGGLNTPLELAAAEAPVVDPSIAAVAPVELADLVPKVSSLAREAELPSGGGGMKNNNPGAGDGNGFGLARFGDGGETIRGVSVKVGDPQFTLLWDTEADLDLHVIEPGGKEIWWEEPTGKSGGELDVDNTKGFGPENIYWLHEGPDGRKVKGAGPPGDYQWYVSYWGGFGGKARPTNWKVRIKHGGTVTVKTGKLRALNERSKRYTLKVEPAGGSPEPGPAVGVGK